MSPDSEASRFAPCTTSFSVIGVELLAVFFKQQLLRDLFDLVQTHGGC